VERCGVHEASGRRPADLHRDRVSAPRALLARLTVDLDVLDAGCCGLAGSFGHEPGERYELSIKVGERVLFPAVRAAPADVLLVADGFSCREQIAHGTGRRACTWRRCWPSLCAKTGLAARLCGRVRPLNRRDFDADAERVVAEEARPVLDRPALLDLDTGLVEVRAERVQIVHVEAEVRTRPRLGRRVHQVDVQLAPPGESSTPGERWEICRDSGGSPFGLAPE
jgi:hypothetical protein